MQPLPLGKLRIEPADTERPRLTAATDLGQRLRERVRGRRIVCVVPASRDTSSAATSSRLDSPRPTAHNYHPGPVEAERGGLRVFTARARRSPDRPSDGRPVTSSHGRGMAMASEGGGGGSEGGSYPRPREGAGRRTGGRRGRRRATAHRGNRAHLGYPLREERRPQHRLSGRRERAGCGVRPGIVVARRAWLGDSPTAAPFRRLSGLGTDHLRQARNGFV